MTANTQKHGMSGERVLGLLASAFWAGVGGLYLALLGRQPSVNYVALGAYSLLIALLFLVRRPRRAGGSPLMFLVALAATLLPMLALKPAPGGFTLAGLVIQVYGLVGAIISLVSLGRSFGMAPAYRGVVTGGAYNVVRHPLYLAELVNLLGYLIAQPSVWNAVVIVVILAAQVVRIVAEEQLLSRDPLYRIYRSQVRWRLIPGVW
jgi:protein-S-isoprenylcysteine O-methyltransferase Ste14